MKAWSLLIPLLALTVLSCNSNDHSREINTPDRPSNTSFQDLNYTNSPNSNTNSYDSWDLPPPTNQIDTSNDVTISLSIRQMIGGDGSLSSNARNIQVTTDKGVVTLRGSVDNAQEKSRIERIVQSVPGVRNISNQLEIIPNPTKYY